MTNTNRGYIYFDEGGTLYPEDMAALERLAAPVHVSREVDALDRRDAERIRRAFTLSMWPEREEPNLDVVENVAAKYADCPHLSMSGDEGPIVELGRFPLVWKCDSCGARIHSEPCS